MTTKKTSNTKAVNTNLSYFTLRKSIGWFGLILPWAAWLFAWSYEPSISDFYYTRAGVLFTSVLILVGVFLISYRGYERDTEKISDNIITWVGGGLIIIVALVPTPYIHFTSLPCPTPICHADDVMGFVHFGSAAGFFACMGYLSIYRFTKGDAANTDKRVRNRIYRFCGWGIWGVLALAGVLIFGFNVDEDWPHLIFWVEVVLLVLFGTSWLVKGKGLVDLRLQQDDD